MIPRLRARCTVVLAAALLWCGPAAAYVAGPAARAVGLAALYAAPAHAATPAAPAVPGTPGDPAAAPAPYVTAEPGPGRLAGRRAGAGRVRPGRAPEPEEAHPVPAYVPQAVPPPRQQPRRPATPRPERESPAPARLRQAAPPPAPLGFEPLPLGAGIALVGLGLGFLGMRMRRR
ncbi:hypothetical protein ACFYVL_32220 [Streptomyces sp. NPDC004111]|uniref:hypothetical protein n=1 Tax=Streptomyces sp. NPDC004111 TaxID=3364690 RepID=UPI00369D263D